MHALLDAEYEPYDVGVMGELDVEIMSSLFGGPEVATALAPAWNGGVYYAAQRRSASPAERKTTGSLGVMYFSQWKTEEAASGFERIYLAELGRKYSRLSERKADEASGEQVFTTEEGDVLLTLTGDALFIGEGFPLAMERKLRDQTAAVQGRGPVQLAGRELRGHELAGAVGALGRLGMLRLALPTAVAERYTRN